MLGIKVYLLGLKISALSAIINKKVSDLEIFDVSEITFLDVLEGEDSEFSIISS